VKMVEKAFLGSFVDEYKKNVRKAGQEVVQNIKIFETAKKIDQLFILEDMYIKKAIQYRNKRIVHYKKSK